MLKTSEAQRKAFQRYARTAKGRANALRYRQSEKGRAARARYLTSDKGKAAAKRARDKYLGVPAARRRELGDYRTRTTKQAEHVAALLAGDPAAWLRERGAVVTPEAVERERARLAAEHAAADARDAAAKERHERTRSWDEAGDGLADL